MNLFLSETNYRTSSAQQHILDAYLIYLMQNQTKATTTNGTKQEEKEIDKANKGIYQLSTNRMIQGAYHS